MRRKVTARCVYEATGLSYIDSNLIPGEKVLFRTRLHTVTILVHVLMGLVLDLIGIFCVYSYATRKDDPQTELQAWLIAGLVLLVVGGVTVAYAILKLNATEMAVTNRRILIKTGFFSRRTVELLLVRVESILINEPFFGRMLGYGTVVIRGTGGTPEAFDCIARPKEFRRCVQEQIEAAQGRSPNINAGDTSVSPA